MSNEKDISTLKLITTSLKTYGLSPLLGCGVIVICIVQSLMLGMETTYTQRFFDAVNNAIGKTQAFEYILIPGLLLGLVFVIDRIANGLVNYLGYCFQLIALGKSRSMLNVKYSKIDPICFENTDFLDDINKADMGVDASIDFAMVLAMAVTAYIPYLIYMGVYLYKQEPILSLIIGIAFLPILINQIIRVKIFSKLEEESAPIRRENSYYEKCICDREYFKETRILGAFTYFKNLYNSTLSLLNKKIWKSEFKSTSIELLMNILSMVSNLLILYLLINSVLNKTITVGAFAAILASINMIFSLIEELINMHIGRLTKSIGMVQNYVRFMSLPERKGEDIEIKEVPSIVLDNVSFGYPKAEKKALDNVTVDIKAGETVAIVGENGSGKTTLVKLITGLYLPDEGSVMIQGHNTSEFSVKSLYSSMSGVFQKFQRYKMTLRDNITISDINKNNELSNAKVAAEKADLIIGEDGFPKGYDTMLSREFDGVDLSGGQWQRIAIARGFYRAHNMIVLDEPTAAIDPVEETKIYNKFNEISNGKTAILVTHRLGSTKIADKIIVMDKGKLVEMGTHDELMKNGAKYAEMYEAQSKWYTEELV